MSDHDSHKSSHEVPESGTSLIGTTGAARLGAAYIDGTVAAIWVAAAAEMLRPAIDLNTDKQPVIGATLAVLLYLFYFFITEWLLGASSGKLFTGLKVRHTDGTKCGIRAVLIRTITRVIEVNPIVLGFLPAVLLIWRTKKHQRLGDMLADTVVIDRASVR